MVFTSNHQSLIGGLEAVTRATRYRIESEDLRPLTVFPLPSRIDVSEPELLDKWRFGDSDREEDEEGYQQRFEKLFTTVYGLPECNLKNYFDEVQIQHVPRYSYGEEIAALRERGTRLSVSRSYSTFADILVRDESAWDLAPSSEGGAEMVADSTPTLVKVRTFKEYLSEERFELKLYDTLTKEVRAVLRETPRFEVQGTWSPAAFAERLHAYEATTNDLLLMQALLGFWTESSQGGVLTLAVKGFANKFCRSRGLVSGLLADGIPDSSCCTQEGSQQWRRGDTKTFVISCCCPLDIRSTRPSLSKH